MLVERGKVEAALMNNAPTTILTASVVKGSGASGGFGGSKTNIKSKSSIVRKNNDLQAVGHAADLQKNGVVRLDNVLSSKTADRLREYVLHLRAQSEKLVEEGSVQSLERFADVLLQNKRCDLKIPLLAGSSDTDPITSDALYELLVISPIGATIRRLLGPDAVLQELSCLMSDPGSDRQVVHPDTPCRETEHEAAVLYTCFVALQDVQSDMGPTTWLPGTHTWESHQIFQDDFVPPPRDDVPANNDGHGESRKDRLLRTQPILLGMLSKGSCGIFDSRLLHCGGANTSETTRAIFYFSFKNPAIGYSGNPPSIRPELVNQFTLADLENELTRFKSGQPTERILRSR